jgi:Cu-processing system ATP-binding protein
VSAALAFLFDPSILILDEPTAGLDPVAVELLKDKVKTEKAKGKLILITSHIMSDLDELTTHLIYINEGRVAYDDPIDKLKQQTGHERLGKAISHIMTQQAVAH